ncbi:MAG: hypothetical protein ACLTQI_02675 [Slackia sp.]
MAKTVTLDEAERELTDDIVIATPKRAVALAGVMGGSIRSDRCHRERFAGNRRIQPGAASRTSRNLIIANPLCVTSAVWTT